MEMKQMNKRKMNKISRVIKAWETLAPTSTFGGLTLEQYKTRTKPLFDQLDKLAGLDNEVTDAQKQRDTSLDDGHGATLLVVNAVKGDPTFGEDSPLYSAMGYVRKSDRRSGLSRLAKAKTVSAEKKPLAA